MSWLHLGYGNSQQHYIGFPEEFWAKFFQTSGSEHALTDDAKHKHLLPKWTKQTNIWGLGLVMKLAKVPYSRNVENCPGTFLGFVWRVWWCSILPVLEVFLCLFKCLSQNQLNVRICVHFCTLRDINEERLPCLGYGGPNHDRRGTFDVWKPSQRNQECL